MGRVTSGMSRGGGGGRFSRPFAGSTRRKVVDRGSCFSERVMGGRGLGNCCVIEGSSFVCGPEVSMATPIKPVGHGELNEGNMVSPLCAMFEARSVSGLCLRFCFGAAG